MLKSTVFALLASAVVAANAQAQALREPQAQPQGQPRAVAGQPGGVVQAGAVAGVAGQVDQAIATCLALGNEEEIAIAQFAKDHAKSDKVKEFIEMMVKDHREALQKLHTISPQLAAMNLNLQGENAGAQPQPGLTGQPGVAGQPAAAVAGQRGGDMFSQMTALQRRVTDECLQLTKRELEEHQGDKFDRCYIGQQIGAHAAMLAKLKGSEEFATGQLRQFIGEATQTVESHLKKAKEIGKSLEEEATGSGEQARRDGQRNRQ